MKKKFPPLLSSSLLGFNPVDHRTIRLTLPRIAAYETLLVHELLPRLQQHGAVLWLAHSVSDAQLLVKGWKYWERVVPSNLPSPRLFLPDRHRGDPDALADLVALLTDPSAFIVAPTMEFPLPLKTELLEQSFELDQHGAITAEPLRGWLVRAGYDYVSRLMSPGEFSVHGDTMMIWAHGQAHALRLSFNGELLERFDRVDVEHGTAGATPTSAVLPPVTIHSAAEPQTIEAFAPDSCTIITEGEPPSFANTIRRPLPYLRVPRFIEELSEVGTKGRIVVPEHDRPALSRLMKAFHLATNTVQSLLPDHPFPEGFILNDELAFIPLTLPTSPSQVLRKESDPLVLELQPGDYVVHLFHGIGRFTGTTWMHVNGVQREFLALQYQGKDRLYVPVDAMDRVERYVGAPDPVLHSLSGTEWLSAVKKAKHYAKDIAYDLLRLQAKREMIEVPPLPPRNELEQQLAASFPYQETDDQLRSLEHIEYDLTQSKPMDRLICGDVGFGKTEIAIRAAFKCAIHGLQVAVLSPTTILTQQHFDTFQERLQPFGVRLAMLSRWQSSAQQKKILDEMAEGTIDIVIGTHRLLSSDVQFKKLGLMIIDEEQRFGVKQKEQLKRFRSKTHIVSLSATPIPRTLHMSLGGLKELSTLTMPPPERKAIATTVERFSEDHIRAAIEKELARHGQVYYLHNRVASIAQAAKQVHHLVPNARLGIAHGQLPEKELADMIKKFDRGEIDVLICSTIIENGLDLKNVNTLIIPDMTNFGLAQLYQIRGRIGRSDRQAYAHLFYPSQRMSSDLRKRVSALLEAKHLGSGMRLAIRDLEIRGAGNLLGKEQHGNIHAIGLSLYAQLLEQAVEELRLGRPAEPIRDLPIDLPLPAFIPPSYTNDELARMRLYHEITHQKTVEDLTRLKLQLHKQKKLPEEMENFFAEMELKLLAQHCSVTSVDVLTRMNGERHLRVKCLEQPSPTLANEGWEVKEHIVMRQHPTDAAIAFTLLRNLFLHLSKPTEKPTH